MTCKRILVPVDFSEHSTRALEHAKTLADGLKASIDLLTVVPDPFVLPNPGNLYVPLPSGYVDGLRRDAEAQLQGALSPAERERFHAQIVVMFGNPPVEIVDYAARQGIDMIVMGTRGRGAVAQALMGGVAEKVVRTAPCPVLTVR